MSPDLAVISAALWQAPYRTPEGQIALVSALIEAMGSVRGKQPDLRVIAAQLGVGRQSLYRTLRVLEAKGVVVRHRRIEIRL